MDPLARDGGALEARDLDAEAVAARQFLDDGRGDAEQVGRCHRLVLGQRDRAEDAGPAQAVGAVRQFLGVVGLAGGQIGDLADAAFAHALFAVDAQVPEAEPGPGRHADIGIERAPGMIGHHRLRSHIDLREARRAPAVRRSTHRVLHQRAARALAGAEAFGHLRLGGERSHTRRAEPEGRADLHLHDDGADGLGGVERRDLRRLAPVHKHAHHGRIVAKAVEGRHQPTVFRPGGREDVLRLAVFGRARRDQGGGALDDLFDLIGAAGHAELEPVERPSLRGRRGDGEQDEGGPQARRSVAGDGHAFPRN